MNRREDREILEPSGLSYQLKLTYVYLWMNRDWGSCIVGDADKKMISYQAIYERLEYTPKPRSNEDDITVKRDRVKRILKELRDMGAIVRLDGQRYGKELRFFLPWATPAKVYAQDARQMRATHARHSSDQRTRGAQEYARHTKNTPPRHTSISNTLSNKYTYYSPDKADWSWLKYVAGQELALREQERQLETEKFNLRNRKKPDYDLSYQREDWRTWLIYWIEHQERKA